MLTFIFYAALIYVAIRMLIWGIKAAWGIAKIIAFVVVLPFFIFELAALGMMMLALGLVVIAALVVTVGGLLFG